MSLISVKVVNGDGEGTLETLLGGLDYVVNVVEASEDTGTRRPSVVSVVLTSGVKLNAALDDAVQDVIDAGITVVVSAGSKAANTCNVSPSRGDAIAVCFDTTFVLASDSVAPLFMVYPVSS